MEGVLKNILLTVIIALVLTAVLQGLKGTAIKSAYDSASTMNVTDSSGQVHVVEASPISGDTTALLYTLAQGLVWLFAVIAILFMTFKGIKGGN